METPKKRTYRRRLMVDGQNTRSGSGMGTVILMIVSLGLVLWIWQPWKSADERILAQAGRFKTGLSKEIGDESLKLEQSKAAAAAAAAVPAPVKETWDHWVAGTSLRVVAWGDTAEKARASIDALKYPLQNAGAEFDLDNPVGALRRLHDAPAETWVDQPAAVMAVLDRAQELGRRGQGAYSPCIGAALRAYHFGDREQDDAYPEDAALQGLIPLLDGGLLALDTNNRRAMLKKKGVMLDWVTLGRAAVLGAAKETVEKNGLTDLIVFAGYDAYSVGAPREGAGVWRWELPDPLSPTFQSSALFSRPQGKTVGAAFVSEKGRRLSHNYLDKKSGAFVNEERHWIHPLIKPSNAIPQREVLQAMAVGNDPVTAVLAARVAFMMGATPGVGFLKGLNLAGMVVDSQGRRHDTPGFAALVAPPPPREAEPPDISKPGEVPAP